MTTSSHDEAAGAAPAHAAAPAARERVDEARLRAHLLGALSHELRTPLQTISSWAKTLAVRREDAEAVGRAAEAIDRAVRQAVRTLDALVDAERVAASIARLEPSALDLPAFVQQQIAVARPLAAAKAIAIETALAEPLLVRADPARLERVVASMLANAIRSTPTGGRVAVSVRACDGEAHLAVADGGPAISAEALPHVFDHAPRAAAGGRPARAAPFELVVAKQLVELHGGRLSASSDDDGATTFTAALPLAPAEE
jgi:two-component system CheB/CheR fusion protein